MHQLKQVQARLQSVQVADVDSKTAAKIIIGIFADNGIDIKSVKGSTPTDLIFSYKCPLTIKTENFGLSLSGKTVTFDSLGSAVFSADILDELELTQEVDFSTISKASGVKEFAKWSGSINKASDRIADTLTSVSTFSTNFTAAISAVSKLIASNKK